MMHYHTIAGNRGYLPDYNEAYETFQDALNDLIDYVSRVEDDCEIPEHSTGCTDTIEISPDTRFLDFVGNTHGVEYVEVSDCNLDAVAITYSNPVWVICEGKEE